MINITTLLGAAVAAILVASTAIAAEGVRLVPVDEAANDATWVRFKARLQDALAKRDQNTLLTMVDSKIRNISGKQGAAEFRKLWEPQSADSALWTELPKLLFLGGAFVKSKQGSVEFCAPYVRYKWPDHAPDDADGALIAKEVLLKNKPAAAAATLQTLSYDLVKVVDWEVADDTKTNAQKWVKILARGMNGYVPEEQIRSPLEHRACFVKSGSTWRMTAFAVGE